MAKSRKSEKVGNLKKQEIGIKKKVGKSRELEELGNHKREEIGEKQEIGKSRKFETKQEIR